MNSFYIKLESIHAIQCSIETILSESYKQNEYIPEAKIAKVLHIYHKHKPYLKATYLELTMPA